MDNKLKIENVTKEDTNDYKELYGKLRTQISTGLNSYKKNLTETKDLIESVKNQLMILETKKGRLEGAIESSDLLLKSVLPSNNKK